VSFFTFIGGRCINGRFGDDTNDFNESGKMDASLYSPFRRTATMIDSDDCISTNQRTRRARSRKSPDGERELIGGGKASVKYLNMYTHHFLVKRTSKKSANESRRYERRLDTSRQATGGEEGRHHWSIDCGYIDCALALSSSLW
jgi:hypothetical protein